jgi:hypothetical protein
MPVVALAKSFVELRALSTAKVHSASRLTPVVNE